MVRDTYNKAASAYCETAPAERKAIDEKSREELQERLAQLPPDKVMAANYIASSARYWYDPEYDAGWLWEDMVVNNDLISHLFGTIFLGYDMFENMNKLDVPVLLVLGKHDYVIPPTIWQDSYDSLTDFTRILLEKSGHTPQLEDPAAFDKILLEWVAEKVDKLNSVQF